MAASTIFQPLHGVANLDWRRGQTSLKNFLGHDANTPLEQDFKTRQRARPERGSLPRRDHSYGVANLQRTMGPGCQRRRLWNSSTVLFISAKTTPHWSFERTAQSRTPLRCSTPGTRTTSALILGAQSHIGTSQGQKGFDAQSWLEPHVEPQAFCRQGLPGDFAAWRALLRGGKEQATGGRHAWAGPDERNLARKIRA